MNNKNLKKSRYLIGLFLILLGVLVMVFGKYLNPLSPSAGIIYLRVMGFINIFKIILIVGGITILLLKREEKKPQQTTEPQQEIRVIKRKMYTGLSVVILGLVLILLTFFYLPTLCDSLDWICSASIIFVGFTFIVPISLFLIIYGFMRVRKNSNLLKQKKKLQNKDI